MDLEKVLVSVQKEQGTITMSRNLDEGIDNSFGIYAAGYEIGRVNLVANEGASVFDLVQNYNTLYIDPVKPRTGSRNITNALSLVLLILLMGYNTMVKLVWCLMT